MSSYVSDLQRVDGYIEKLVEGVRSCIQGKSEYKTEIPLYIYATGGVRKLSDTDQHQLFASIRNSHFPFRIHSKTVLSGKSIYFWFHLGEQEATFGLFAVAALHNAVSHVDSTLKIDEYKSKNKENESNKPETDDSSHQMIPTNSHLYTTPHHQLPIGACDLGGESFEIGYFSNISSPSPIVRSFSAFGVQRAVDAVLSKLNYTSDVVVDHPCYPVGYSEIKGSFVVWGTGRVEYRTHVEHSLSFATSLLSRCLGKTPRSQN